MMAVVAASTISWAQDLIAAYGRGRSDGTVEVTVSQAEVARTQGCSPGTVSKKIRALRELGWIVSTGPIVFTGPTPPLLRRPAHQDRPPAPPTRPHATPVDEHHQLRADLAAALAQNPNDTYWGPLVARALHALYPHSETGARAPTAPHLTKDQDLDESGQQVSSSVSVSQRARSRQQGARDDRDWTNDDLARWVDTLTRAAEQVGANGLANLDRIANALHRHPKATIEHAVKKIAADTVDPARRQTSSRITSPFGLLYSVASAADGDERLIEYFRVPSPAPPAGASHVPQELFPDKTLPGPGRQVEWVEVINDDGPTNTYQRVWVEETAST